MQLHVRKYKGSGVSAASIDFTALFPTKELIKKYGKS